MMSEYSGAFADPDKKLPFNTNVVATIRTEDNEPVYSRLYPFPMGAADFVNQEIKDLLKNGIIRPSRSPYNNPIWVVGKKGTDASGSPNKRLVIDLSESNPNAKIKRWKARIDESGAKMFYKPGKENLVADALSRQQLNVVEAEEAYSCEATIHSEVSLTHTIETTEKPLNCFQNQITLEEARSPSKRSFLLFGNKRWHDIDFTCMESLLEDLADTIVPKGVSAIHCDLHTLAMIQDKLVQQFPATKFWHC
ncbi:hypothetical protein KR018_008773, partial [Drosophila ironensis]